MYKLVLALFTLIIFNNSFAEVISRKVEGWCETGKSISIIPYESMSFTWGLSKWSETCHKLDCAPALERLFIHIDNYPTTKVALSNQKDVRMIKDAASLNFLNNESPKSSPKKLIVFKDDASKLFGAFKISKVSFDVTECFFHNMSIDGTFYIQTNGSGDFSN